MARRETPRAQRVSVAGGSEPDLRSGEKMLPTAQAGARLARDASGDSSRSYGRLTGDGSFWTTEHRFYPPGESDRPSRSGSARTTYVGHVPTGSTAPGPSGVVACLLSSCASSCIVAGSAHAASRTRGQTSSATLPTAYTSDGSRKNQPTMDGARGALLPIAAGSRLRATEVRSGWQCHVTGRWVKVPAEELGWSLASGREGLSALSHDKKPARNGFGEG
jgi:hypothetical protein